MPYGGGHEESPCLVGWVDGSQKAPDNGREYCLWRRPFGRTTCTRVTCNARSGDPRSFAKARAAITYTPPLAMSTTSWETEDMGSVEAARAIEPLCMLWCIPGFIRNQW